MGVVTSAEQPSRRRQVSQRLGKLSAPYWIVSLSILLGTVGSVLVAAQASDPETAKIFQTVVTPILTLFAGGVFNDLYHRLGEDRQLTADVRKSAYASLSMLQSVLSIRKRLASAENDLIEGNGHGASASIQVALAMTTVSLRQVLQNLRLWGGLSAQAVDQAKAEFEEDETAIEPEREQIAMGSDDIREVGDGNG